MNSFCYSCGTVYLPTWNVQKQVAFFSPVIALIVQHQCFNLVGRQTAVLTNP